MVLARDTAKFELYHYHPSLGAAVLFVILFFLTTGLHTFQLVRTRTWFFIAFTLGGACELIGYVARAVSASQKNGDWTLTPYIIQSGMSPGISLAGSDAELDNSTAISCASLVCSFGIRVISPRRPFQIADARAIQTYQELGRIVELCDGDQHLFVKRKALTAIFVSGDVLSFLMQASGKSAALVSSQLHCRD